MTKSSYHHHVGRALFGWRSFSLRAKKREPANHHPGRRRKTPGRNRESASKGWSETWKSTDEEDECDDDDIPRRVFARKERRWWCCLDDDVPRRSGKAFETSRGRGEKTNTKPSRAFTGWLREEDFRATDDTSAFWSVRGHRRLRLRRRRHHPHGGLPSPNEANVRALFADQEEESAFYSFQLAGDTIVELQIGTSAFRTILGVECEISRVNSEGTVEKTRKLLQMKLKRCGMRRRRNEL